MPLITGLCQSSDNCQLTSAPCHRCQCHTTRLSRITYNYCCCCKDFFLKQESYQDNWSRSRSIILSAVRRLCCQLWCHIWTLHGPLSMSECQEVRANLRTSCTLELTSALQHKCTYVNFRDMNSLYQSRRRWYIGTAHDNNIWWVGCDQVVIFMLKWHLN